MEKNFRRARGEGEIEKKLATFEKLCNIYSMLQTVRRNGSIVYARFSLFAFFYSYARKKETAKSCNLTSCVFSLLPVRVLHFEMKMVLVIIFDSFFFTVNSFHTIDRIEDMQRSQSINLVAHIAHMGDSREKER